MGELDFMIRLHEFLPTSGFLTTFMKLFSQIGDHGIVWIMLGLVMLCFKRSRVPGMVMLLTLAIGWVINDFAVKDIIARPRPVMESDFLLNWVIQTGYKIPSGFSFPSGHALAVGACCFVLAYFYKWHAVVPIIIGAIIAVSRVYISAHYPTDVLAGIAFGMIIARLITWAYEKYYPQIVMTIKSHIFAKKHNARILPITHH